MRKLIFVGLAFSAALIAPPRAVADTEWCRYGRDVGGAECIFHTFEQCAASTERLNGGNCIRNPGFHGATTASAAVRKVRAKGHHKPHQDDYYR